MAKVDERFYEFMTEDGEVRACEKIPDSACEHVPRNFSLNVLNGICSKLAERLISPGITLPWILSFLGAPAFFAGMLVPLKNTGSLLPQLFVSAKIRAFERRKIFWTLSGIVQAVCILPMGFVVVTMEGSAAAWAIVGLLLIFSMASGVASVAFKDVVAKTIDKGERGQMLSSRASIGGIFSLAAGLVLIFFVEDTDNQWIYFTIFIITAGLWFLSSFFFNLIKEPSGATEGGRSPVNEIKKGLGLLKKDPNLTQFIITRALLMAIPLATPFYVLLGKNEVGGSVTAFGLLIITDGIANIISSPFWGRYSDKSSRKMMMLTAALGIFTAIYAISFVYFPEEWKTIGLFLPVFLLNGMAHAGARLSRKTYLVDFAPEKERPLYVSLSNTLIGVFTLVAAGLGFVAEIFSLEAQLIFFAAMMSAAIILGLRLKEVE
ncbi:MAG: MFS transporter [Cyclobacteriaceae bacterium]|nr:MFS transporter [Cyclobacteriaceae bacterium]MCH8514756.1 MFS transporter [Cyclobacteriaceae bacterium]